LAATSLENAEAAEADDEEDTEDRILKEIRSKGRQPNISFFAFTATPKKKTVELFGTTGADGVPRAFHLYAMRQAIEEGFILDVLANYATYSTYYRFEKAMEDDPEVDKSKAKRALAQYASLHPHNLAQKAEVMIEHYRAHTRHKIGGRGKAMVVTRSRLHAVRYKKAFEDVIAAKGYMGLGVLVAFSGTVNRPFPMVGDPRHGVPPVVVDPLGQDVAHAQARALVLCGPFVVGIDKAVGVSVHPCQKPSAIGEGLEFEDETSSKLCVGSGSGDRPPDLVFETVSIAIGGDRQGLHRVQRGQFVVAAKGLGREAVGSLHEARDDGLDLRMRFEVVDRVLDGGIGRARAHPLDERQAFVDVAHLGAARHRRVETTGRNDDQRVVCQTI
jgi:hypothetical protein